MESVSRTGITFRTKCLTLEQAGAFARCLSANDRFTEVGITESTRAKSDKKWIVSFLPTSEARQQAMVDRQQNARARRACEQEFTFALCTDHPGRPFFFCHSHQSGEVYELAADGSHCNCPDATWRCHPNGLRCKHELALLNVEPASIRPF